MSMNKIVPSLWYHADGGKISGVLEYYKQIFGDAFAPGPVMPMGDTPSGYTELCQVTFFGQMYSLMCTAQEHHSFNDAFALTINCEDQQEIDRYWDYFTKDGSEVQCGWCIDKYGLRWQIIPSNLGELMSRPNALRVIMGQKKIVIAEYLK